MRDFPTVAAKSENHEYPRISIAIFQMITIHENPLVWMPKASILMTFPTSQTRLRNLASNPSGEYCVYANIVPTSSDATSADGWHTTICRLTTGLYFCRASSHKSRRSSSPGFCAAKRRCEARLWAGPTFSQLYLCVFCIEINAMYRI